ncbi:AAA family ATPase [Butyrivibrio sp. NC2002]|uniref:AAA family ATPase n=1 Tax=Butyrivibrio sp. NC2002 TaxID=1410610 RepID=UPI00055ABE55|nr:AAA family ATPase [Butyrivibrio sp. NC2002]
MGIYLNPSNSNFTEAINTGNYVDKTMMIDVVSDYINTNNKYICMSRPRRFGKTIAGNMLAAYYSKGCDSDALFSSLKIASTPKYRDNLNKYNVIQIDLNSEYQNIGDKDNLIKIMSDKIKEEIIDEFPDADIQSGYSLAESMQEVFTKYQEQFVLLIDEYDVYVRENVPQEQLDAYLSFLNGLFKSNTLRPAIAFAYLTGILPIVRDKIQSKLNNFHEYTFVDAEDFSEYIGFTAEEVKEICKTNNIDYKECCSWYDGYHQNGFELFNPESVVKLSKRGRFEGYWGKTSSYKVISDRIRHNTYGIKDDVIRMLAGESVDVNVTSFMNTMNSFETKSDIMTYLIHLGYLTYDYDEKTCRIPNGEVRQEWMNAIEIDEDYKTTDEIIKASRQLLDETIKGNGEAVEKALDVSHIHVTSNRSYNNEDALQSAIYLAYLYALNKYTVVKEMTTGKGFADVVYIPYVPNMPAMIIELKKNKTAESAINQIKEKKYFDSLSKYSGNLLFVGINYDENSKTHTCTIESFVK